MTEAAKLRRTQRRDVEKHVLQHLQTRSVLRFHCRPSQLRAAARQIARNVIADYRRRQLAEGVADGNRLAA